MNYVETILSRTIWPVSAEATTQFGLKVFAFILLFLVFKHAQHRSSKLTTFFSIGFLYLGFRLLTLGNPFFLTSSYFLLQNKTIGDRPKDTLRFIAQDYWRQVPPEFLAVGSSQMGALYGDLSSRSSRLQTFAISGMGPLDFNLYFDQIVRKKPKQIILTLSDFDLGRKPSASSSKLAPAQTPKELTAISRLLFENQIFSNGEIFDFLTAQLLVEYRIQYLFKGLVKTAALKDLVAQPPTLVNITTQQGSRLAQLNQGWFRVNELLLHRFLDRLHPTGIKVTIVEGHYQPDILAINRENNRTAKQLLKSLCDRHPYAQYLALDDLPALTSKDFRDPYHIRRESGFKLSKVILSRILHPQQ